MADPTTSGFETDDDGESGGAGIALVLWLLGVPGLIVLLALLFL